jgi:small subunit ribosomal protein S17
MAEKKVETSSKASTPAKKASAARKTAVKKPAAKKAAAKKAAVKKPAVKKPAAAAARSGAKKAPRPKAARPAPERVPGRKERRGIVVSSAMDKTIVIRIDSVRAHDRYGKVVRRSSRLHVHDEQNVAGVGDTVRVVETRPLSATKRWRLLEVLEKAK